jgi:hypothetical protein
MAARHGARRDALWRGRVPGRFTARMRRLRRTLTALTVALGLALATAGPAGAGTSPGPAPAPEPGPAEFGTDWHDPVTAAPPVAVPGTRSCTVTVAEARFRDFTPYTGTYTPPTDCGRDGHWAKIVLRMDGSVAGRQYDRLGYLHIGGVEVFRTSTPEPSPDGIEWSVEKDVTRYEATLAAAQPVEMLIGNVVDDTYTGILDVKVTLTFYAGRAAGLPDRVIPLTGTTLTTPRNSERIVAEVYATGSGGGCEEVWYTAVTPDASYSCRAGTTGPYREVQVSVDGRPAGIAAPFPHVWTGGWSPFLWYVIPAPRAFDVPPVEFDLTPFAGLLNDGRPHTVDVSVLGVPEGQSGWSAPANILVWQDAHRSVVRGALTTAGPPGDPAVSTTYTPETAADPLRTLTATGSHHLTVSGYLDTSHGRVTTTVTRAVGAAVTHRWTPDEATDNVVGTWTDDETVTVDGVPLRTRRTYTMDARSTVGADNRLGVTIALGDHAVRGRTRLDNTYRGDAAFTLGVPRDQRHGVGTATERYRLHGPGICYDRTITAEQGALTRDALRC